MGQQSSSSKKSNYHKQDHIQLIRCHITIEKIKGNIIESVEVINGSKEFKLPVNITEDIDKELDYILLENNRIYIVAELKNRRIYAIDKIAFPNPIYS